MRREVLPNGLRVLTVERPATPLVALKLFLKVGSRHDGARPGLAHFVEHMLFNREWPHGRSPFQRIEAVGGEINAVTHREYTALQAVVLAKDAPRVFEAFGDVMAPLQVDRDRAAREREVLLHEIERAADTQSTIWDRFLEALWGPDDPLARPIYGTAASVRAIDADDLRTRFARYPVPARMVLAAAGGIRHEDAVALASEWVWEAEAGLDDDAGPAGRGPGRVGIDMDLQATYLVVGVPAVALKDPRRPAVKVMDIILGKGASSRLHRRLREEQGAVYQVTSVAMAYEDRGYLCAYTSSAPANVPTVIEAILDEFETLRRSTVSDEELESAKAHYEGALARHFETVLSLAGIVGVEELLHRAEPFAGGVARVRAVTAAQVRAAAEDLLDQDRVALAYVGRARG